VGLEGPDDRVMEGLAMWCGKRGSCNACVVEGTVGTLAAGKAGGG
jgi:hypothetical protein